jgi:hypothetical protein
MLNRLGNLKSHKNIEKYNISVMIRVEIIYIYYLKKLSNSNYNTI